MPEEAETLHVRRQDVNSVILGGERAEYGKQIVSSLATQLVKRHGKSFDVQNIRKMVRFSESFSDIEIVSELAKQLSWTHLRFVP